VTGVQTCALPIWPLIQCTTDTTDTVLMGIEAN
jgi:hypothetical protein